VEIVFPNRKLLALYESGSRRPLRLEQRVVDSFFEVVAILEAAKDIHDLWRRPGLNFEKLRGTKDRYSARLDRTWRLEMNIEWTDQAMTIGIIGLDGISKHYGG
jgi:toxin HigB-1